MKKRWLLSLFLGLLLAAMLPVIASAASGVKDIEIVNQYYMVYSTDYFNSGFEPENYLFTYQFTLADGTVVTTDYTEFAYYGLDPDSFYITYCGDYASDEYPVITRSGKQAVEIHYKGDTFYSYMTITGLHDEFEDLSTTDDDDLLYRSYDDEPAGYYFWHIKMSSSGVYTLYSDPAFSSVLDEWCVRVFDKYNNEVPAVDGYCKWPLTAGQDYYLSFYYYYLDDCTDDMVFWLTRTGSMSGSSSLAAPTIHELTNVTNGVTVKWDAVAGASKYRVFYKTPNGSWTSAGDTTSTSMTVSGLTSGIKYTFTVRCVSSDGKSYTSGFDSTGKSITYLTSPKLSYVGTSVKGVELKWNAVKGAENYGVWYKTATGSWTKAGNTTGTSYVVSGLTSGTTYTFTVRCLSADGKTYMSGFDSAGKTFTYLATPTLTYIGTSVKGIEVEWNAVKNAENYGVWYKTATGSWTKAGNTTGTSMVVSGLTSGTTYTFTVRCLSADGKTYMSGFDSVGKTFTYLATPTLTYIGTSVKGVEVEWKAVSGAVNYGVWYKTATGSWTKAGNTTGTSMVVSGLTSGTTYTFTVRCLSADGKTYLSGFDSVGKTFTYLATPVITAVGTNVKGVEVKWNAVKGAVNYGVWYKTATGSWTKAGNTTGTSYVVEGLTYGTTYTFTVRCLSADGKTYLSGFDSVGKDFPYLETPHISWVSYDAETVDISWAAVTGAYGYRVFFKTAGGSWVKAGDTTDTTYSISGLTWGESYTFTVRCIDASGNYTSIFDANGFVLSSWDD